MTTSLRPALRIVRTGDDIRDAELDLANIEHWFEKCALLGKLTFSAEQLQNYAAKMRNARVVLARGRKP